MIGSNIYHTYKINENVKVSQRAEYYNDYQSNITILGYSFGCNYKINGLYIMPELRIDFTGDSPNLFGGYVDTYNRVFGTLGLAYVFEK